jgi:hypothetical protein
MCPTKLTPEEAIMSAISTNIHNVSSVRTVFSHFDHFSSIELTVRDEEGNDLIAVTLFVRDAVEVGKVLAQLGTGIERK